MWHQAALCALSLSLSLSPSLSLSLFLFSFFFLYFFTDVPFLPFYVWLFLLRRVHAISFETTYFHLSSSCIYWVYCFSLLMHVDAVEGLAFQGLAYFLSSLVFSAEVYTAKRLSGWLSEGWDRLGEVSLNDLGLCCTFTAHVLSLQCLTAHVLVLPFPSLPLPSFLRHET